MKTKKTNKYRILTLLGLLVISSAIVWAHERFVVHPGLTIAALNSVNNSFYTSTYRGFIEDGSRDEDAGTLPLRHGYNPISGRGFPGRK